MDRATKKALEGSIAHWKRNVAAKTLEEISTGHMDCDLCGLFFDGGWGCYHCPIATKTGDRFCRETPYYLITEAIEADDFPAAHEGTKDMLKFLEGLRE